MNMRLIWVVGNVNVDCVVGPSTPWPVPGTEQIVDTMELRVGGGAANTAMALAGMNVHHRLIGCRGEDMLGRWIASQFEPDSTYWTVMDAQTALTVCIVHPDSERTFLSYSGHLNGFRLENVMPVLDQEPARGDIILLTGGFMTPNLLEDYPLILRALRDRGLTTAIDTGWPPGGWKEEARDAIFRCLNLCDHLLLNEVELLGLTGTTDCEAAVQQVLDRNENLTIIAKLGKKGARVWKDGTSSSVSAETVAVVDSVGAGDTFNAGFLAAIARDLPLDAAIREGTQKATRAISSYPRCYQ